METTPATVPFSIKICKQAAPVELLLFKLLIYHFAQNTITERNEQRGLCSCRQGRMDLIRAKKAAGFSLCMLSLVFVSSAQHFKSLPSDLHKLLCTFFSQILRPNLSNDNDFDRVTANVVEGNKMYQFWCCSLQTECKRQELAFNTDVKIFPLLLGWRQKANAGVHGSICIEHDIRFLMPVCFHLYRPNPREATGSPSLKVIADLVQHWCQSYFGENLEPETSRDAL